jgi:hypothetical protein
VVAVEVWGLHAPKQNLHNYFFGAVIGRGLAGTRLMINDGLTPITDRTSEGSQSVSPTILKTTDARPFRDFSSLSENDFDIRPGYSDKKNNTIHTVRRAITQATTQKRNSASIVTMSKLSLLITACVALLIAVHQVIVGTTHELIPLAPLLLSPAHLVARNNSTITSHRTEEDVKVLLFITTIFSQNQQNYFDCCWPRLMEKSKLLQRAHVVIFSNNVTAIDPHIIEHTQQ